MTSLESVEMLNNLAKKSDDKSGGNILYKKYSVERYKSLELLGFGFLKFTYKNAAIESQLK